MQYHIVVIDCSRLGFYLSVLQFLLASRISCFLDPIYSLRRVKRGLTQDVFQSCTLLGMFENYPAQSSKSNSSSLQLVIFDWIPTTQANASNSNPLGMIIYLLQYHQVLRAW